MNNAQRDTLFLELFRRAANSQPIPDGGHVAEDDELLACWADGLLSQSEYAQLIEHLSLCPRCRQEVAAMIRAGVLEPAAAESETEESETNEDASPVAVAATVRPVWLHRRRLAAWTAFAAAAMLLVVLGNQWWPRPSTDGQRLLAQADQELHNGNARQALEQVEQLLTQKLDGTTQQQAERLLEEAGYTAAAAGLEQADFHAVLDIERRVADRAEPSPRLWNLKLQAERGYTTELALDAKGSLLDFGCEFSGRWLTMGADPLKQDPTAQRLGREFEDAREKYPRDTALLLNQGHLLLSQQRLPAAAVCFRQVLDRDRQNVPARLGLGLTEFAADRFPEARLQFEEVLKLAPENVYARINLAVCLERLGQAKEARPHWNQARALTSDQKLQQEIEHWLDEPKPREPGFSESLP